jgi:hypothetical protein
VDPAEEIPAPASSAEPVTESVGECPPLLRFVCGDVGRVGVDVAGASTVENPATSVPARRGVLDEDTEPGTESYADPPPVLVRGRSRACVSTSDRTPPLSSCACM